MATATLAPSPISLRRRILRNGSRLLGNEVADLVNVPATANLARALREWAASLKPEILQAPATNDENARQQACQIEEYARFAAEIAERLGQLGGNGSSSVAEDCLILLGEFDEYLSNTDDELRDLQNQSLAVKFACQDEVKRQLETKKEQTLERIILFCFKNGLLSNSAVAQSQVDLQQFVGLLNCHIESTRDHFELLKDQQLGTDEMVRRLIAREVSAVLQARQTDGRNWTLCIVFGSLFFFHTCKDPVFVPGHDDESAGDLEPVEIVFKMNHY